MPRKTVLIVEDEPMVRNLCAALLRAEGFHTILAGNGTEGLAAYSKNRQEIDLVLSDIAMPFLDGIEMARQIFALDPEAHIIFMSGAHLGRLAPENMQQRCSSIQKPFSSAELMETIKTLLARELSPAR